MPAPLRLTSWRWQREERQAEGSRTTLNYFTLQSTLYAQSKPISHRIRLNPVFSSFSHKPSPRLHPPPTTFNASRFHDETSDPSAAQRRKTNGQRPMDPSAAMLNHDLISRKFFGVFSIHQWGRTATASQDWQIAPQASLLSRTAVGQHANGKSVTHSESSCGAAHVACKYQQLPPPRTKAASKFNSPKKMFIYLSRRLCRITVCN